MAMEFWINGRRVFPPPEEPEPRSIEELEDLVRQGITLVAADDAEAWNQVWPENRLTAHEWALVATIAIGYCDQILQMLVQAEDPYGVGLLGPEELATEEGRAALTEAVRERWRRIMEANARGGK